MQVSDRQGCKHSQRNTDTKRQRQSQIQETDPRDMCIYVRRGIETTSSQTAEEGESNTTLPMHSNALCW